MPDRNNPAFVSVKITGQRIDRPFQMYDFSDLYRNLASILVK